MIEKRKLFTENSQYEPAEVLLFTIGSSMIWIMVPGLAFLYSGLARRKNALSMIWIVMVSSFVGIFQWYFWGYSLAFSGSSNKFIGNLSNFSDCWVRHIATCELKMTCWKAEEV
jgi:Amt family ammonium transporter